MEVKQRYKQTEAGVIPEDWDVKPLRELCAQNGLVRGPFGSSLRKEFFVESGIKVYEQKNAIDKSVEIGSYFIDNSKYNELKRFEVFEGDFIVSCSGTIGKIFQIPHGAPKGIINQALLRIKTNDEVIDSRYFILYFDWAEFQERIIDNTQGGAMKNLVGMPIFKNTSIALPRTKTEQTAIANALSDADALITSVEKLIVKKRNIKQGAMQQLLTGKKRLPGFSRGWETERLGSLGSTYSGLSGKTKQDFGNGSAHYITFLNILNNVVIDPEQFECVKLSQSERQNQVLKGDLFFNGSSETPEEVGMCAVLLADVQNVFLNSFCFGFRLHNEAKADGVFLAYFFRSNKGRELLYTLAQGATRYNLSKTSLLKLELHIPRLDEQRAIASVLSDIDAEIEALEQKLAKYRLIKQGMMQELLTGKKRLI